MACQTLLKRGAQLALLERACQQRVAARVALRRGAAAAGHVHLVALERDGVLVSRTEDPFPAADVSGQPVEVRFEHEGEHYVFFAVTCGHVRHSLESGDVQPLLKLSLPLRLERARRRRHPRLSLGDLPPIMGTFTHVVDGRRQFRAQITDVSAGGVGIVAPSADVCRLHSGDLFWVDMELPGEQVRSEFVVRLVHLRPVKNTHKLAMGWALQPTDDAANYERYLSRLERLVAQRQKSCSVKSTD